MTKRNIYVSEETYLKLRKIKEENNLKSFDDAILYLESLSMQQMPRMVDSLELVLSELADEGVGNELQELFSDDNIEKKGDINARQVMALAKAKTFADRYNNQILNDFIYNYIVYSVSKDRKGRKEFVESFKAKILEPLGLGSLIRSDDNASTSNKGK